MSCDVNRCNRPTAVVYAAAKPPRGVNPEIELCDMHWERLAAIDDPERLKAKLLEMTRR